MVMQREPEIEPEPAPDPDTDGEPSQPPKIETGPGEQTAQGESEPEAGQKSRGKGRSKRKRGVRAGARTKTKTDDPTSASPFQGASPRSQSMEPVIRPARLNQGLFDRIRNIFKKAKTTTGQATAEPSETGLRNPREFTNQLQKKVNNAIVELEGMFQGWLDQYANLSQSAQSAGPSDKNLEGMYGDQEKFKFLNTMAMDWATANKARFGSYEDEYAAMTALRSLTSDATNPLFRNRPAYLSNEFGTIRGPLQRAYTPLGPVTVDMDLSELRTSSKYKSHAPEITDALQNLMQNPPEELSEQNGLVQVWSDTAGNSKIFASAKDITEGLSQEEIQLVALSRDTKYAPYIDGIMDTLTGDDWSQITDLVYDGIKIASVSYSAIQGDVIPGEIMTATREIQGMYIGGLQVEAAEGNVFPEIMERLEGFTNTLRNTEQVSLMQTGEAKTKALQDVVTAAVNLTHLSAQAAMTMRGGTTTAEDMGASWLAYHTGITTTEAFDLIRSPWIRYIADPENTIANDIEKVLDKLGDMQPPITSGTVQLDEDEIPPLAGIKGDGTGTPMIF